MDGLLLIFVAQEPKDVDCEVATEEQYQTQSGETSTKGFESWLSLESDANWGSEAI